MNDRVKNQKDQIQDEANTLHLILKNKTILIRIKEKDAPSFTARVMDIRVGIPDEQVATKELDPDKIIYVFDVDNTKGIHMEAARLDDSDIEIGIQ